jgi:uncharacterized RDD family membrane protein YckC
MTVTNETQPIRYLSVSDIPSVALRIYCAHFFTYCRLAFRALLWLLIPIYGAVKSYAIICTISRLAFHEVIGESERVEDECREVNSQLGKFFTIDIQFGFLSGFLFFVSRYVLPGAIAMPVIALGFLLPILFFLRGEILAIEDNMRPSQAIARSFDLIGSNFWRFILVILMLALFLSLTGGLVLVSSAYILSLVFSRGVLISPFLGLTLIPYFSALFIPVLISALFLLSDLFFIRCFTSLFVLGVLRGLLAVEITKEILTVVILLLGISIVIFLLLAIFIPFIQCLKGVIYYDFYSRQQELDLPESDRLFKKVSVLTSKGTRLHLSLAGIGDRVCALAIDFVILHFSLSIFLWVASFLPQELIRLLIPAAYFIGFETAWQGQTPGKRLVKIKVVRDNGKPIQLKQVALRTLLFPIDIIAGIGAFLIFFGKKEKRFGDMAAGTIVIKTEATFATEIEEEELADTQPIATAVKRKKVADAQPIVKAKLPRVPAFSKPRFPISKDGKALGEELIELADVSLLEADKFAAIQDYLQKRKTMTKEKKTKLSQKLAGEAKKAIALDTLPRKVSATVFLEAVYFAYQQQDLVE